MCSGLTGRRSRSLSWPCSSKAPDLFDPWPIKIVLDYALGSRPMPEWIAGFVLETFGEGKLAIIYFAAIATVVVAAVGAIASYIGELSHDQSRANGSCSTSGRRSIITSSACRSPFTIGPKPAT